MKNMFSIMFFFTRSSFILFFLDKFDDNALKFCLDFVFLFRNDSEINEILIKSGTNILSITVERIKNFMD